MMRLDKYLSERLGIPRGESRKLAANGRVTVNGVLPDCWPGLTRNMFT